MRAATTRPSASTQEALPSPPFTRPAAAPRPAPALPSAKRPPLAASQASRPRRRYGGSSPHSLSPPLFRSNRIAAGMIGTVKPWISKPLRRFASHGIIPAAASSPKADPPARQTASTAWAAASGRSRSVSRVPDPPPRTSTEQAARRSGRITVTPVRTLASTAWPTVRPSTSVSKFNGPGRPILRILLNPCA